MRFLVIKLIFLAAILVSACDLWPKDLQPLAESITKKVSGETTAWLVSGDIVVIDVAGSPLYRQSQPELEVLATEIAGQAIAFSATPLESIVITFHAGEVSEDPGKMREFVFLVRDNRPALQPNIDMSATGPLTSEEVKTQLIDRMDEPLTAEQEKCVLREVESLARDAGDPETLDPASVEFLPAESWNKLDAFGKRLILAQAIMTMALFDCQKQMSILLGSE